jgi:hypothetical protein
MPKQKTISLKKFEKALDERQFEVVCFYVCASKIVFTEVKTKLLRHVFLFIPDSYSFVVPQKTNVKIVNVSLFDDSYSSLTLPFLEKSTNFSKVDFVTVTGRMITHYGEEIVRWSFDNPETEVASESEDIDDLFIDLDSSSDTDEELEEIEEEDEDEEEEEEEEDDEELSSSSEKEEKVDPLPSPEKSPEEKPETPEEKPETPEEKPEEKPEGALPEKDKKSTSSSRKSKESSSEDEPKSESEEYNEEIVLEAPKMQPIVAKFAKQEVPKPYPTPIPSKIAETDVEIGALYPCYRLSTFLRIDRTVLEETIFQVTEDVKDIELDSRIQRFIEIKELYGKVIQKLEDTLASAQKDDKSFFINFRKLGTLLSKSKDKSVDDKVYKVAEEMNMEAIENREKVESTLYNFLTIGKLLLEE